MGGHGLDSSLAQSEGGPEGILLLREVDQRKFGNLRLRVVQRRPLKGTMSSVHHPPECGVGVIEGWTLDEEGSVV